MNGLRLNIREANIIKYFQKSPLAAKKSPLTRVLNIKKVPLQLKKVPLRFITNCKSISYKTSKSIKFYLRNL